MSPLLTRDGARLREVLGKSFLLIAGYYIAARLGQVLAFGTEAAISPVWPPAGVGLAGMLIFGWRYWPALMVADIVGTLALADAAPQIVANVSTALMKALIYAAAAYLLRRVRFDDRLDRETDVLSLLLLAAPLTSALTATLGMLALLLSGDLGQVDFPTFRWLWWLWWIGDVAGVVVLAPLLITWAAHWHITASPRRIAEALLLVGFLGMIGLMVFSDMELPAYAIFPPVIWAALRFGPRGAAVGVLVVDGLSIWFTTHADGPFVLPSVLDSLAALETFIGVVAATAMILAAAISERRNADRATRFQARLLDAVNQGVIATDADERITYWNSSAGTLYGWTAVEALGKNIRDVLDLDGAGRDEHVLERIARGDGWTGEVMAHRRDRTEFPVLISSSPLIDAEGDMRGAVTVSADLSDLKRAQQALRDSEERLRQSQKMEAIGLLAGGVAHDFNNVLTAIIGYSELLLKRLPVRSPHRRLAEEISNAGDRAASLTRQLLIFSRQQVLQPTVLNLNEVVRDVQKLLGRIIGEDVALVTDVAPDLWSVQIDSTQIEQVLMNLAVNARDAMPEGGTLTIHTANVELEETATGLQLGSTPGRYVMLSVTDTGNGMDSETRSRMFEPFFTTKERGRGTGLGLSTVFGIVKQSGGDIGVESTPNQGTTIRVYLPRVLAESVAASSRRDQEATATGRETILLVEDELTVRALAREVLREAGYTVIEAESGDQAVALAGEHVGAIDLVLTDVVMPGMSGLQVAERLSADRPDARILFMSGFPGDIGIRDRERLGNAPFLSKPFAPPVLAQKVRDVLDGILVDQEMARA